MNRAAAKEISFARFLSRREMLRFMGAGAAIGLMGCRRRKSRSPQVDPEQGQPSTAFAAAIPACVARPEQTEGPYFVDERLNRSDIRSEPSDNSVKPGVPLRLVFHVSRVDGNSCNPFKDAMVHVWHCDALGVYSDVRDPSFDTRGKKFLRGYQLTDVNGIAEFLTIYPGWYEGRAVHIHFKMRAASSNRSSFEYTSQLYFDESVTDQVHKQPPYNGKGYRTTTNEKDFIFRRGGKQLMPVLTKDTQGYAAKFEVGLQIG